MSRSGAFGAVFGERRGRDLNDTMLGQSPTTAAREEFGQLAEELRRGNPTPALLALTGRAERAAASPLIAELSDKTTRWLARDVLSRWYQPTKEFVALAGCPASSRRLLQDQHDAATEEALLAADELVTDVLAGRSLETQAARRHMDESYSDMLLRAVAGLAAANHATAVRAVMNSAAKYRPTWRQTFPLPDELPAEFAQPETWMAGLRPFLPQHDADRLSASSGGVKGKQAAEDLAVWVATTAGWPLPRRV